MHSRLVLASFVSFVSLAAAACGGKTATTSTAPAPAPAAPTNTSIATARALAAGDVIDLVLPCTGKVYFGPIQFASEGQRFALASTVRSVSGQQVCGGGALVDGGDVQQAVAGSGCIEGTDSYAANLEYVYAPGAGNSPANPIYLSLWSLDGAGGAVGEGCGPVGLRLEIREAP